MNSEGPLKFDFDDSASFAVEFIDADDDSGRGIRTVRGRVRGRVKAASEVESREIVRRAIRRRYPVGWSMNIGEVHAVRL